MNELDKAISKVKAELVPAENMEYYLKHKEQLDSIRPGKSKVAVVSGKLKKGDLAECSECHTEQIVHYLYGGTDPLCRDCCKRVLN